MCEWSVTMSVGRNESCPCGSGKKYKKCCMKKEKVVQLKGLREEKFYQQKAALTGQISEFLHTELPTSKFLPLETQFKKRTNHQLETNAYPIFTQFWLTFCYTFDNGMRGIDWFLKEKGNRLTQEEREMAEQWAQLKLQFVEAVDRTEDYTLFKDLHTEETYKVSNSPENLPYYFPWMSTIGLLEKMGDRYYFNGVREIKSPKNIDHAKKYVDKLVEEHGLSHEQVMRDYYPEILQAAESTLEDGDIKETELTHYHHQYKLHDVERVENFLYNNELFEIDVWNEEKKQLIWVNSKKIYTDNMLDEPAILMSLHATIEIRDNMLQISTYEEEILHAFSKKIEKLNDAMELVNEEKETFLSPLNVSIQQSVVRLSKETPHYFGLYTQLNNQEEIDQPIPAYNNQSLRELMAEGKTDVVDIHLKDSEYNMYHHVMRAFEDVDVTADFNTVRKELGLPLSPFVTGGEKRYSSISEVPIEKERNTVILRSDIPIYEGLGFTPTTVDAFYTADMVSFYVEKTKGKSAATEKKYRTNLYDLRELLEEKEIDSWDACDMSVWEAIFTEDIFEMYDQYMSKTHYKEFTSTIKALIKELAKEDKIAVEKEIIELVKQCEQKFFG